MRNFSPQNVFGELMGLEVFLNSDKTKIVGWTLSIDWLCYG